MAAAVQGRYKCLLCADTAVFDSSGEHSHADHPTQPMISDEALIKKFGTKADDPEYHEINVFNCPYCDRQRLSITALYDHLTREHLDVPFNVRCPVCVCFMENHTVIENAHLSKHLADDHSTSQEQFQDHVLIYDIFADDERELLRFLATTLPPAYSESSSTPLTSATDSSRKLGRMCPICLDLVFESKCRELSCKHKFHRECIDLWTAQNRTCPVCRKSI